MNKSYLVKIHNNGFKFKALQAQQSEGEEDNGSTRNRKSSKGTQMRQVLRYLVRHVLWKSGLLSKDNGNTSEEF